MVDDDKIMLEAISHVLKGDGHEVVVAENGLKALRILAMEHVNLVSCRYYDASYFRLGIIKHG